MTVVDSGFHAVDSEFKVLDSSRCRLNLDPVFQSLVGFRISWTVLRIPKPRIPDSTSKTFPDSLKWERFCGANEDGLDIACEQALHFGAIVKSRRESGSEGGGGGGGEKDSPRPLEARFVRPNRRACLQASLDISKCINTTISKSCVLLMLMFMSQSSSLAHKLVWVAKDKAGLSYCQFSAVEFQTTSCPLYFSGIYDGRNKRTRAKIAMRSRKDICSFSARVTIWTPPLTPSSTTSRMFIQLALS